jgi:hypothetical protein
VASGLYLEKPDIGVFEGAGDLPRSCSRHLFKMLPNSNFWLNPLSECQKPLPASEIALLLNGKIFEKLATAAG